MGQYIYAIVEANQDKPLRINGISGENDDVSIICYQDIGAVISPSPIVEYPVTRKNTTIHQTIMEKMMANYPMLPVRFGTIGEDIEIIKEKVLKNRYDEIKKHLAYLKDKVELGLKVLWVDYKRIFQEIIDEDKNICKLRDRLNAHKGGLQKDQIRLGDMVENALKNKREQAEKKILKFLDGLFIEHKKNKILGDQMITNSVFLVVKEKEHAFDEAVDKIDKNFGSQIKIKYIGPVPPCNFVELIVKW